MVYTLIRNGVSYDLPPYSLNVSDSIEKINAQNIAPNSRKKANYQLMIDFIVSEVGADNANTILGGTSVTEVDLQEVAICYLEICKSYDRPIRDAQKEETRESLNSDELKTVLEILKNADNIEKLKNSASKGNFQKLTR